MNSKQITALVLSIAFFIIFVIIIIIFLRQNPGAMIDRVMLGKAPYSGLNNLTSFS